MGGGYDEDTCSRIERVVITLQNDPVPPPRAIARSYHGMLEVSISRAYAANALRASVFAVPLLVKSGAGCGRKPPQLLEPPHAGGNISNEVRVASS